MTSTVLKVEAVILLLLALAMDLWLPLFRCAASPDVAWSRLGFGVTVQALLIAGLLLISHIYPDESDKTYVGVAFASFVFFAFTYLMVRDSALFGDSVDPERKHDSKGLQCPGVESVFITTWLSGAPSVPLKERPNNSFKRDALKRAP